MKYSFRSNSVSKNKYNAKPSYADGIRFHSILEKKWYLQLKHYKEKGVIDFFLRQVPFDVGGGVTYRADFLTFYHDGHVEVMDVKGVETETFKIKKKIVEENYGVEIQIIDRHIVEFPMIYFQKNNIKQ